MTFPNRNAGFTSAMLKFTNAQVVTTQLEFHTDLNIEKCVNLKSSSTISSHCTVLCVSDCSGTHEVLLLAFFREHIKAALEVTSLQ